MDATAIELTGVIHRRGDFVLGPLDLNIPRGTICGLIGPNGAGKTTLLSLLMGLGKTQGQILLLGRDLASDAVEIKRRVAYAGPDLNYETWGTVGRAIDFVQAFYPDWDEPRCLQLQENFGLPRRARVSDLSFGARMKLGLLLALSRNAEMLLLDEPTIGLDALSRRQLFAELLTFMQREDRTIVISSHHLTDLERFADHIAMMGNGRLLVAGRTDHLIESFGQIEVASSAVPKLQRDGLRLLKSGVERAEYLIDYRKVSSASLQAEGVEIIAEKSLGLEDLFIAMSLHRTDPLQQVA